MTRREAAWLAVGSLAFALVFSYPMLCELVYLGPGVSGWITTGPVFEHLARFPSNGDADMFAELRWVPYWTVVHFHQFPFWNPYKCGGLGLLSNPETSIITPFFLVYWLFGPHAGEFLDIFLHVALAFAGGYVLGRVLRLGPLAAAVCGAVFPCSSWLYVHMAVGHLNFLPAAYMSWIAAMLVISADRKLLFPAAIGGVFYALTLTEGNYPFLYAAMIVGLAAAVLAVERASLWPLISASVIGLFGIALSALRLIPMAQQLTIYPKHPFGLEAIPWRSLAIFLFSRNQDLYRTGTWEFGFSEYGAYISLAFVALALAGIAARPMKSLPWLVPAAIFLALARGATGPDAPVMWLRYLPLSGNLGLPGRYLGPAVLCLGIVAADGAEFISTRFGNWGRWSVGLLLVVALLDSWVVSAPNGRYLFHNDVSAIPRAAEFRQFWVHSPDAMSEIAEANMGSVHCGYGYDDVPQNPLGYNQPGYRGEYYLLGPGRVVQTQWTPNLLSYSVDAAQPTTLVINQNNYPGWRLVEGRGELTTNNGLIAVRVSEGHHQLVLRFRPTGLWPAIALTLLGIFAAVWVWLVERKR